MARKQAASLRMLAVGTFMATGCATAGISITAAAAAESDSALRVAVYSNFQPFSCRGVRGSDLIGVDVDIANELAKRLDRRLELVSLSPRDSMDEDLQILKPAELDAWGDRHDGDPPHILMHAPQDPVFAARNASFRFLAPYYFESMAVLYDREQLGRLPDQVSTADEFVRARIGVEMYTLSYVFLTNGFSGKLRSNTSSYKSVPEAVQALTSGDVEAVFAPRTELQSAVAQVGFNGRELALSEVTNLFRTDRVRSSWDVGLAMVDGQEKLAGQVMAAMQAMHEDGTVARILEAYGIPAVQPLGTMEGIRGEVAGVGEGGRSRIMHDNSDFDAGRICHGSPAAGLL